MNRIAAACFAIVVACDCAVACAQANDDEVFRLRVRSSMTINSINNLTTINHNLLDQDQRFPPQFWTARSRNAAGAIVTFETKQAFTSKDDATLKRDARLELSKVGSRRWRITKRSDETDYKSGDEKATVTAESNRPGAALFRLQVTFLEESVSQLPAGEYQMTVHGTIVAK